MDEDTDRRCSQNIVRGNTRALDCRRECKESGFAGDG